MKQPRGIRNNNPGNLERTNDKWIGMSDDQSTDSRFVIFKDPLYGIRAITKVILTYQKKYNLGTIAGFIERYSPPCENDTVSYINTVSRLMGVGKHEILDISDIDVMINLIKAIITVENGTQPYNNDIVKRGILLAYV